MINDPREFEIYNVTDMPPNVTIGVERRRMNDPEYGLNPEGLTMLHKLKDLILPFVTQNPSWHFTARYQFYRQHITPISEVYIYRGKEQLGSVSINGRNGKYYITSPNIRSDLERGRGRETGDLKKARKYLATICPMTCEQKGQENMDRMKHVIGSGAHDVMYESRKAFDNMLKYLSPHIKEDIEKYIEIAQGLKMPMQEIDILRSSLEKVALVEPINEAKRQGAGVYVLIEGNTYIISEDEMNNRVCPHTVYNGNDDIPAYIKRGVGMLKLSEDRNFISGVGFKLSNESFFVLKEQGV